MGGHLSILLTRRVKLLLEYGAQMDLVDKDRRSPLHIANEKGNTEAVKLLLEHGAHMDLLDKDWRSPLRIACEKGNVEAIKLHGSQVDLIGRVGESPLLIASEKGNAQAVKLLLEHGAQMDLVDKLGRSPLHIANEKGNTEAVKLLLEHGVQMDMDGWSPLHIACEKGNVEAMKLLLEHGSQVDLIGRVGGPLPNVERERSCPKSFREHWADKSPLQIASEKGNVQAVTLLLEHKAQVDLVDKDKRSPLLFASKKGNGEVVKLLLEHGAQVDLVDNVGRSPLHFAREGRVVKLLLEHGAQVNFRDIYGTSPLHMASMERNVKLFLEHGAQANLRDVFGRSPLHNASKIGNKFLLYEHAIECALDVVKLLLEHGAEVDLVDEAGQSPLHIASEHGYEKVVELLLQHGAQVNLIDGDGRSPLHVAGRVETVKLLLQEGAQVDLEDKNGRHPLHVACEKGYLEVTKFWLEHRVSVGRSLDLQNNDGWTSLMLACQNGHRGAVSLLLDADADIYIPNNRGQTALDVALCSGRADIVEQFIKLRTKSSFPGIFFSEGAKKEVITSANSIKFDNVGISLSIPEGALPSTDLPLEVQIQPCFSGSWEVPENLELVSPAYIVKLSSSLVTFKKDVLVKIWHHANLETEEDCEDMVFLSASTTPEYRHGRPVYVFQEITGVKGLFRPREEQPAGVIALKQFSLLGIFRRIFKGKGHLYSARLYTVKEIGMIIFCMCLFQPQYIDSCDRGVASQYKVCEEGKNLVAKDGVTITAEEVLVELSSPGEWRTFCNTEPASILKEAISRQTEYEPETCNLLRYLPKIEISITNVPRRLDSEPLKLKVKGLNVKTAFQFSPGEFVKVEIGTTKMKVSMEELNQEIKRRNLESSENNILSIATQVLNHMKYVEEILIKSQCPLSVSNSVVHLIQEINENGQRLKNEVLTFPKGTHEMKARVEDVTFYSRQLKDIYSSIHHSTGSTSEWDASTSLFIKNAANLMSSIKNVLKASRSAQNLPNNCLPSDTSHTTPAQDVPHSPAHSATAATQAALYPLLPVSNDQKMQLPLAPELTFMQNPPPACVLSVLPSTQQPSKPPPKPLSIEDMGLVYRSLYPLRAKWNTLGTFLYIDHSTLQVIKEDNESSDDRLTALVALWLRRINPAATWQALHEAVQYIDPNQAQQIRGMAEGLDGNLASSV